MQILVIFNDLINYSSNVGGEGSDDYSMVQVNQGEFNRGGMKASIHHNYKMEEVEEERAGLFI